MYIIAEVTFLRGARKSLPLKGYRPDIIVNEIADSYWGITFLELDATDFECASYAEIRFSFQEIHYSEIEVGYTFMIMEGRNNVGHGVFLSLEDDK